MGKYISKIIGPKPITVIIDYMYFNKYIDWSQYFVLISKIPNENEAVRAIEPLGFVVTVDSIVNGIKEYNLYKEGLPYSLGSDEIRSIW